MRFWCAKENVKIDENVTLVALGGGKTSNKPHEFEAVKKVATYSLNFMVVSRIIPPQSPRKKKPCYLNIYFSLVTQMTHQVAYKAQIGDGEQSNQDVEPNAVQRRHIDHHKVYVDRTNQQDDDAAADLPKPERNKKILSLRTIQILA